MSNDLEVNFCRRCGKPLVHKGVGLWECANKHSTFNNPSPTVGIFFLTADKKVVLSRRGINPGKGMLDCFGGFVESGESIESAAHREITEETGLVKDQYGPLHYFYSSPATYHFQDEDRPIITSLFWAALDTDAHLAPNDDVAEIVTLPLGDVNPNELFNDDIKTGFIEFLKENL